MNETIQQLKNEIIDLESFTVLIDREQLKFPLDKKSIDVVHTDIVVPTGNKIPLDFPSYDDGVEIVLDNAKYLIDVSSPY